LCKFWTVDVYASTVNADSPMILPEPCLRCTEKAICSYNVDKCIWSREYTACLDTCGNYTIPKEPEICSARCLCDCLGDSRCGWCQNVVKTLDSALVTASLTYGTCFPLSLSGKCTGEVSAANEGGTFITAALSDCTSTDASLNIKDPSIYINDVNVKEVLAAVNTGRITEGKLQELLTVPGVIIKRILSAAIGASDGGIISTLIEIDITVNVDLTTLCQKINECYRASAGDRDVSFDNCRIEQSQPTKKRATTSTYVHTSNVHAISSPPPPNNPGGSNLGGNSSSYVAPTLFLSLVILFLFRFM